MPPTLDPGLCWVLRVSTQHGGSLPMARLQRLAEWERIAASLEAHRDSWLRSLPVHCEGLYRHSGFHGPLFHAMHRHLVDLGYPDGLLWRDVCQGMPSGVSLPRTGLCPLRDDAAVACQQRQSTRKVFAEAPSVVEGWRKSRRPDKRAAALITRNEEEVSKKRRVEISLATLAAGSYVAHPEFMTVQANGKERPCDDCSASGWNDTTVSEEKLALASTDDPVDYASRLLAHDPLCEPWMAVGDEESAYRNWANGRPDALVMLVFLRKGIRAWRDHALCFGDTAGVYGYNRIRTFLTVFFRVEFALAMWSFYDDSGFAEPRVRAQLAWHIFIRVHALLKIPLKGDPGDLRSAPLAGKKFFPPAPDSRFLGEQLKVDRLPCNVRPTASRKESGLALIDKILSTGRLHPGDASSVFGKLRFVGSELHGRCGIPALQPISARQSERRSDLTPALRSALKWLRELLAVVGPREWPWCERAPPAIHIFGDASEPGPHQCYEPTLVAVLRLPCGSLRGFAARVPRAFIRALPPQAKHIHPSLNCFGPCSPPSSGVKISRARTRCSMRITQLRSLIS